MPDEKKDAIRASKETAREARTRLTNLDPYLPGTPEVLEKLEFIRAFLDAAEAKLPSDAAYDAEAARHKKPGKKK